MKALRVIFDEGFGARRNIALTAAMAELHGEGRTPDTLRVYRYPRAVLLGRNQDVAAEIDRAECNARGIEIARRITGGGAIYMDRGVTTWDLLISRRDAGGMHVLAGCVCGALAAALSRSGIAARFRAENDIVVGSRKLAGASGYSDGETLVYQGSLLVAPDLKAMAAALKLPSVADHVTSLAAGISPTPRESDVMALIVSAIADALDRVSEQSDLIKEELNLAAALFDREYGRDDFIFSGEAKVAA
ncbi:MAG: lipoate--protein ligase family protein [Xanthobacteraceae bacterium]|nr:lipoate--protein ligase family protein [Xanthobacteraceae bacterium]